MQGVPDHSRLVSGDVIPGTGSAHPVRPAIGEPVAGARMPVLPDGSNETPARRKAGPVLFWSTCLLAAFLVFWMSGGHRLILEPLAETIRNAPSYALQIENVTSRLERIDGGAHLIVEGAIRNQSGDALAVPPIMIAVAENDGPTTRYLLDTDRAPLAPGAQYGFSTRLGAPANGAASVSITFQEGSR